MEKKLIYLEGMGGPAYPLNCCEVYYTLPEEGGVKIEKCQILWGEPISCEGCPRDKVMEDLFGDEDPQRG